MNYESMSDFEINKAVAIALDVDGDIENITQRESKIKHLKGIALIKFKGYFSLEQFNPCNKPSDAWPIIIDNYIVIEPRKNKTSLAYTKSDAPYEDENPLRAAMIVFLMMNESK